MHLSKRITAFSQLGNIIRDLSPQEKNHLTDKASWQNAWFTSSSVMHALDGLAKMLNSEKLTQWTSSYRLNPQKQKTVGIAMAGNIPLVGFHDFLCVLISGNKAKIKLSSQDNVLLSFLIDRLIAIEPSFKEQIDFAEQLKEVDAIIATGSDNTSRYFEYYFRKIPNIIRKNRSSCAVILGEETTSDLERLGEDVFTYFGLGCRNVSKLFVPEDYDFNPLLDSWKIYEKTIHHHKYANNYDYQKSILLVNRTPFLDSNFILLTENTSLVSPISVLFYEYYQNLQDLHKKIKEQSEKIQCITSVNGWYEKGVPFGMAQYPNVWDYADNVDTLKFLDSL